MKMKADYDVVLGARNNKQNWMAGQYTGCKTIPLDITSMDSVRDAIVEVRPHIVIHAAATKFVDPRVREAEIDEAFELLLRVVCARGEMQIDRLTVQTDCRVKARMPVAVAVINYLIEPALIWLFGYAVVHWSLLPAGVPMEI